MADAPHEGARQGDDTRPVVLAALALYVLLLAPVFGDNENRSHALMESLYARRSVTIDVARFPTSDLAAHEGLARSGGAPGVAFVGLLGYVPTRLVLDRVLSEGASDLAGYVAAIVVAAALPAAFAAWCLARVDRPDAQPDLDSTQAVRVVAFGTLILPYASRFMSHALVLGAVSLALLVTRGVLSGARGPRAAALAGFALALAVTADYPAALALAGLFAALVLAPAAPRARLERALAFALGALPPLALLLVYHAVAFGSPLRTPYAAHVDPATRDLLARGVMGYGLPAPELVVALLLGARAGLLLHAPAVVPGLAGAVRALRGPARPIAIAALALPILYLLLNAGRHLDWAAGATIGPRYLLVALPFALVFLPSGLAALPPRARAALEAVCVLVAWLQVQQSLFFFQERQGFVDRMDEMLRAGPQLGWVRLSAHSFGWPSPQLVPLLSATLLVAYGVGVGVLARRAAPRLALVAAAIAGLTLLHLALRR